MRGNGCACKDLCVCLLVCVSACRCACMCLWLLGKLSCLLLTRGSTDASAELTWECITGLQSSRALIERHASHPPHWTGKAAIGSYVMQVIAWCVYSYSAPLPACPAPAPPAGFSHAFLLWFHLASQMMAKQKVKITSLPTPLPAHSFMSILLMWPLLKATLHLRISTCPPPTPTVFKACPRPQ